MNLRLGTLTLHAGGAGDQSASFDRNKSTATGKQQPRGQELVAVTTVDREVERIFKEMERKGSSTEAISVVNGTRNSAKLEETQTNLEEIQTIFINKTRKIKTKCKGHSTTFNKPRDTMFHIRP
jgi:hypothetical protein